MRSRRPGRAFGSLVFTLALAAGCGPRGGGSTSTGPGGDGAAPGEGPYRQPAGASGPAEGLTDADGDGVPDSVDRCPQDPMVMSADCPRERWTGCPDDCRPPTIVVP